MVHDLWIGQERLTLTNLSLLIQKTFLNLEQMFITSSPQVVLKKVSNIHYSLMHTHTPIFKNQKKIIILTSSLMNSLESGDHKVAGHALFAVPMVSLQILIIAHW